MIPIQKNQKAIINLKYYYLNFYMENNFLGKNNTSVIYKKILKDFNLSNLDSKKKRELINSLIQVMKETITILQFNKIDENNLESIIGLYVIILN